MAKKILTTPIKDEDLADIKAGDIIYLNGHIVTCRDVAHRRLIEGGRELPVNVAGGAILHAGPIVRPIKVRKINLKWSPLGRPPVCAWRNLKKSLLPGLA